jgi:hypothetical protein
MIKTPKPQTLTLCIKDRTITRMLASPKLDLLEQLNLLPNSEIFFYILPVFIEIETHNSAFKVA